MPPQRLRPAAARLRRTLLRASDLAARAANRLPVEGAPARACAAWFLDEGDRTRRLDYALGPDSVVLDVGGYRGQWASDVHGRFGCVVHAFEPVPEFFEQIQRRFTANPRIVVHPVGLGGKSQEEAFHLSADATSLFGSGGRGGADRVTVRIEAAVPYLRKHGLLPADLVKLNIEGGEYELLEHFAEEGVMPEIGAFQIQFHDFVPNAHARAEAIRAQMSRTHTRDWDYPGVWESWSRTTP